ncbi:TPA: nitric oxide reductase transcriptional regulator NorR [Morganella morganii subsp. morganii]|nr:nitric oxide reductase transcriptional regulator NorR [Morganella morganii subsp. morganii]
MGFSVDVLTGIAIALQRDIGHQDRFQRLVSTLRRVLNCDAAALLRYESHQFIPLAIDGLSPDVLGRRFRLDAHPRLEAIARAGDVVRFPADSQLPDPYDGLIPDHIHLKVHACAGLPLFAGQNLIGALTLDSLAPDQFDTFSDEELRLIAALAAGALNNALLIGQLENQQLAFSTSAGLAAGQSGGQTDIIGLSPCMMQLKKEIAIVAGADMNVLVSGETGTGKELVVQSIHELSARRDHPLVYLNCAALPETVAESELFGHVKGAFTGAISNRSGKFEMADNGTLFLDEIGELSPALQAKLLRVLQYGDIQRIGDDRPLRVNVRVLAATNRDLRAEVAAGRFRADLFHRLSMLRLALLHYHWPGNVRELEHAVHRAIVLARATGNSEELLLQPHHFSPEEIPEQVVSPETRPAEADQDLRTATDTFQAELIRTALTRSDGSWAAAARRLGIDAGNLHRLAKRLGLK